MASVDIRSASNVGLCCALILVTLQIPLVNSVGEELDLCGGIGVTTTGGRITSTGLQQSSWANDAQCSCSFIFLERRDGTNTTFDTFGTGIMDDSSPVGVEIVFTVEGDDGSSCDPFVVQESTSTDGSVRYHVCPGEADEAVIYTMTIKANRNKRIVVQNPQMREYKLDMTFRAFDNNDIQVECGPSSYNVGEAPVIRAGDPAYTGETPNDRPVSKSKAGVRAAIAVCCVLLFLILLGVVTYLIVRMRHKKHLQEKVEEHQQKARENGDIHVNRAFTSPETPVSKSPAKSDPTKNNNRAPVHNPVSHNPTTAPIASIAGMGLMGPDSEFGSFTSIATTPNHSFTGGPHDDFVATNPNAQNGRDHPRNNHRQAPPQDQGQPRARTDYIRNVPPNSNPHGDVHQPSHPQQPSGPPPSHPYHSVPRPSGPPPSEPPPDRTRQYREDPEQYYENAPHQPPHHPPHQPPHNPPDQPPQHNQHPARPDNVEQFFSASSEV